MVVKSSRLRPSPESEPEPEPEPDPPEYPLDLIWALTPVGERSPHLHGVCLRHARCLHGARGPRQGILTCGLPDRVTGQQRRSCSDTPTLQFTDALTTITLPPPFPLLSGGRGNGCHALPLRLQRCTRCPPSPTPPPQVSWTACHCAHPGLFRFFHQLLLCPHCSDTEAPLPRRHVCLLHGSLRTL